VKALLAALVGLWIASVGPIFSAATSRFAFGQMSCSRHRLRRLAIVCFALAEVPEHGIARRSQLLPVAQKAEESAADDAGLKDSVSAFVNGSVIVPRRGHCRAAVSTIRVSFPTGLEKAVVTAPGAIRNRS